MKIFTLILALFIFTPTPLRVGGSASIALAKESPAPSVREVNPANRRPIKGITAEVKGEIKNLRDATKEELQIRKEEFKTQAGQRQEEFQTRLEEIRAKAKEEIEIKRAELKERLQKIKDEQKKKIVENIERQLNALNEKMMNHFSNVLDKLEKGLVNIKSRVDKAEARGWDVSAVRAMIVAAEEAIAAARAAIEAQSEKIYTPVISGEEEKLRVEVGQARQSLHNDIAAVKELVRLAFEAVRRVAVTLAQVPRIDEDVSPSPTP